MAEDARKQLIDFLERRAFDPVLRASERDRSESEKKALADAKERTEREKERYRGYQTAGEVRQQFLDDLSSEPAQKVQRELKRLGLPALPDLKDEFLELCDRLGVERGERTQHATP